MIELTLALKSKSSENLPLFAESCKTFWLLKCGKTSRIHYLHSVILIDFLKQFNGVYILSSAPNSSFRTGNPALLTATHSGCSPLSVVSPTRLQLSQALPTDVIIQLRAPSLFSSSNVRQKSMCHGMKLGVL